MDLSSYRAFMIELAEKSGDFVRPLFASPGLSIEFKADESPVTAADKGAETLLRSLISKKFPSHGIIGEELGNDRSDAEFVWVLDPIDGTKSFITGVPLFGTLIALMHNGQPLLGAIHQPILRQLMIGDGSTATLNGRSVRVRPTARLEEATFLTSDQLNIAKNQNGAAYEALIRRTRLVRTWGDCYGYLLLAAGWADVMCDPIMNPWDIQALIPIIRGAGGVITDWQGRDPVRAESIVAANATLHPLVIAALNAK